MPKMVAIVCILVLFPLSCTPGGRPAGGVIRPGFCASWDYAWVTHRARKMGNKRFDAFCKHHRAHPTDDFRHGFVQSYIDLAHGGLGTTPALPPSTYWGARYRSAKGYGRVQEWFDGYASGTILAESDGVAAFNTIPLSRQSLQTLDPGMGVPPPVAVVDGGMQR